VDHRHGRPLFVSVRRALERTASSTRGLWLRRGYRQWQYRHLSRQIGHAVAGGLRRRSAPLLGWSGKTALIFARRQSRLATKQPTECREIAVAHPCADGVNVQALALQQ